MAICSMLRQYIAIQAVPSDCSYMATGGQGRGAVEDTDVVQAEEAAFEDVEALRVLAVHPPGEVQQQLLEDPFEEGDVANTAVRALVHLDTRAAPPRPEPAD